MRLNQLILIYQKTSQYQTNFFINTNIPALILILNIWEIDIYNKIIYVIDIIYKIGFILLANIFIYQFSNFYILQVYSLDIF